MRHTIMTEKIARRGVRVPADYAADYLDRILVRDACTRQVVTLRAEQPLHEVRAWLDEGGADAKHQGFPVVDAQGALRGVVTRRDLLDRRVPGERPVGELVTRPALVVREDHSLREAADHMVGADVGRLVVLAADGSHRMAGIITRGDLLAAHARRLREAHVASQTLRRRPAS
jgi:CBS domain-containing protein